MSNWKEQIAQLPENERLELTCELIESLSEPNFNHIFSIFYCDEANARISDVLYQILDLIQISEKGDQNQVFEKEDLVDREKMKAWIRQQIAENESKYAEKMKLGLVKTYTLAELKAKFNG